METLIKQLSGNSIQFTPVAPNQVSTPNHHSTHPPVALHILLLLTSNHTHVALHYIQPPPSVSPLKLALARRPASEELCSREAELERERCLDRAALKSALRALGRLLGLQRRQRGGETKPSPGGNRHGATTTIGAADSASCGRHE